MDYSQYYNKYIDDISVNDLEKIKKYSFINETIYLFAKRYKTNDFNLEPIKKITYSSGALINYINNFYYSDDENFLKKYSELYRYLEEFYLDIISKMELILSNKELIFSFCSYSLLYLKFCYNHLIPFILKYRDSFPVNKTIFKYPIIKDERIKYKKKNFFYAIFLAQRRRFEEAILYINSLDLEKKTFVNYTYKAIFSLELKSTKYIDFDIENNAKLSTDKSFSNIAFLKRTYICAIYYSLTKDKKWYYLAIEHYLTAMSITKKEVEKRFNNISFSINEIERVYTHGNFHDTIKDISWYLDASFYFHFNELI